MKQFLLTILISSPTLSYAQQHAVSYHDYGKKFKHEDYYLDAKGQPNGKYVAYFLDGTINVERFYKNGELNGKETLYYNQDGRRGIAYVYNYKNGKKDGLQQEYIEPVNGEYYFKWVKTEEFYRNDSMIWSKTYDEDDNGKRYLAKEEIPALGITRGFLSTGHQCYEIATTGRNFQDGNSLRNKLEFTTIDGKKQGLYREWYSNGQLADSCYYDRDELSDVEVIFDTSGHLLELTYYVEGKPFPPIDSSKTTTDSSGNFKKFFKNGRLAFEGKMTGGQLDGEYKMYFENGQLFKLYSYQNGILNGTCKTWKLEERTRKKYYLIEKECNYQNGKLHGPSKTWTMVYVSKDGISGGYENELKSEYNYNNGDLDGECIDYYNEDGGTDIKILYQNGKMTRRWARTSSHFNPQPWLEKSLDDKYYK